MNYVKKTTGLLIAVLICSMTITPTIEAAFDCGCSSTSRTENTSQKNVASIEQKIQRQKKQTNINKMELEKKDCNKKIIITPLKAENNTGTTFLAMQRDGLRIERIATIHMQLLSDGICYEIREIGGKNYTFSVNSKGVIGTLEDDYWACVAGCIGEAFGADPWGTMGCLVICSTCLIPPHIQCIICVACLGAPGIVCLIQCIWQ